MGEKTELETGLVPVSLIDWRKFDISTNTCPELNGVAIRIVRHGDRGPNGESDPHRSYEVTLRFNAAEALLVSRHLVTAVTNLLTNRWETKAVKDGAADQVVQP